MRLSIRDAFAFFSTSILFLHLILSHYILYGLVLHSKQMRRRRLNSVTKARN